jgi:gliding motility-associated-like protein
MVCGVARKASRSARPYSLNDMLFTLKCALISAPFVGSRRLIDTFLPALCMSQILLHPRRANSSLRWVFSLGLLSTAQAAFPNHLVGGDLSYAYLGALSNGDHRYEVTLAFYMDCATGSPFANAESFFAFNNNFPVGIYAEDPQQPSSSKQLLTTLNMTENDAVVVNALPTLPAECSLTEGACLLKFVFKKEVDLSSSTGGYHLFFHRYSRDGDILNLDNPAGRGIGNYAFIPPTATANSSPVFDLVALPFLCAQTTNSYPVPVYDPDGDVLEFSFGSAVNSQATQGGDMPAPNVLAWPLFEVPYEIGYSPTEPFGSGGSATINSSTGATELVSNAIGKFVIAVQVKEYRNGNLLSTSRSELMVIMSACEPNNIPALDTLVQQELEDIVWTVPVGGSICIDAPFVDGDGQELTMVAQGAVFDEELFDPPAVFNVVSNPDGSVTGTFCWSPSCSQGQDQPALFNISVTDNACPPATKVAVVQVQVVAPEPLSIDGPDSICSTGQAVTYNLLQQTNGPNWSATNGILVGPSNTEQVDVEWAESGTLYVEGTNAQGCVQNGELPVAVLIRPDAAFTSTLELSCDSLLLRLISTGSGGDLLWDLGNGFTSVDPVVISGYSYGTQPTVTLVASASSNCADTAQQVFSFGDFAEVLETLLPNVISPNQDGLNDDLDLLTNGDLRDCSALTVFDRWGVQIFDSGDRWQRWRGTAEDGSSVPEGVYFLELRINEERFRGNVQVLR